jgi:hypothetical protein
MLAKYVPSICVAIYPPVPGLTNIHDEQLIFMFVMFGLADSKYESLLTRLATPNPPRSSELLSEKEDAAEYTGFCWKCIFQSIFLDPRDARGH